MELGFCHWLGNSYILRGLGTGLRGGSLTAGLAVLEGGAWAGEEAEVVARVVDDVPVVALVAVARDEAGVVLEEDGVLAIARILV